MVHNSISIITKKNQRNNGPVNAHLIIGAIISIKHTKPGTKWLDLGLHYS